MITGFVVKCDKCGITYNIGTDRAEVEIIGDKMLVLDRWMCNDCIKVESNG